MDQTKCSKNSIKLFLWINFVLMESIWKLNKTLSSHQSNLNYFDLSLQNYFWRSYFKNYVKFRILTANFWKRLHKSFRYISLINLENWINFLWNRVSTKLYYLLISQNLIFIRWYLRYFYIQRYYLFHQDNTFYFMLHFI